MRLLHGMDGLRAVPPGSFMAIGNFDGVHRGHQRIIQTCVQRRAAGVPAVVVTFEPHPLTVLRPSAVQPRLTPADMKEELIRSLGTDLYVILPPTQEVLNLSAEDFWRTLRDEVKPEQLIEGPGFTFGKDRRGDVRKLAEWAAGSAVRFELIPPMKVPLLDLSLVPVSSSLIRWLLGFGRVRDAAICLGRPYTLRGEVVKGFGRGKGFGVPTANLKIEDQLIPADAVYAGRCRIGSTMYTAAVSIGNLPTFGGGPKQIEAHLLDFDGDLYGRKLDLELVDWLRDQLEFPGVDSLKAQIARDISVTRRRGAIDPAAAIAKEN
jgi:riboflavin kinase/FMN adenylyltransferase